MPARAVPGGATPGGRGEVSNDIRALEARLAESQFNLETWLAYRESEHPDFREYVGWTEQHETQRFRLLYRSVLFTGDGPHYYRKPLIECDLETRLAAHPYLPELLNRIAR